jgi:hypothetical protein
VGGWGRGLGYVSHILRSSHHPAYQSHSRRNKCRRRPSCTCVCFFYPSRRCRCVCKGGVMGGDGEGAWICLTQYQLPPPRLPIPFHPFQLHSCSLHVGQVLETVSSIHKPSTRYVCTTGARRCARIVVGAAFAPTRSRGTYVGSVTDHLFVITTNMNVETSNSLEPVTRLTHLHGKE